MCAIELALIEYGVTIICTFGCTVSIKIDIIWRKGVIQVKVDDIITKQSQPSFQSVNFVSLVGVITQDSSFEGAIRLYHAPNVFSTYYLIPKTKINNGEAQPLTAQEASDRGFIGQEPVMIQIPYGTLIHLITARPIEVGKASDIERCSRASEKPSSGCGWTQRSFSCGGKDYCCGLLETTQCTGGTAYCCG